jgi:bifunctional oligoribonuclease and PAP phosphatase NrnA
LDTTDFKLINDILSAPKNISILVHKNPDGDAIGSALGLYLFLLKQNHNVKVISPNEFPSFLAWMPSSKEIIDSYAKPELAVSTLSNSDIIFCLDFNSIERTNFLKDIFKKSEAVKILIDHHPQPDDFCDYKLSEINTSSTAELVYDFIVTLGKKDLLDKPIAECLYVGIMTDTGSFSYSCNFRETYHVVAELIKQGIDVQLIHNLVYDTYSENRLRLLGYCLNSAMKVIPEYNAAYISLSKEDLKKYNFQIGDTEGFVNYPISMKNVCLSALFMEMGDQVKISFRSKGNFNVNEFARKHFDGGGHKNAAGGRAKPPVQDSINKFEQLLSQYKDTLIFR